MRQRIRGLGLLLCVLAACDDGGGDDLTDPCVNLRCEVGEACQGGVCVPQRRLDGGADPDAAPADARPPDRGAPDAARPDAARPDAAVVHDASPSDAAPLDASPADDAAAPPPDAAPPDASPADDAVVPLDGQPADGAADGATPADLGPDAAPDGGLDAPDRGPDAAPPDAAPDAACVPGVEACNGLDDDCDGVVDEDFPALGAACEDGVGACRAEGHRVCAPDGVGTVCDVQAGLPGVERCNDVDDDCDGATDEDFPTVGQGCEAGIGACAEAGTIVCAADGESAACDAVAREAADETCNGLDDDCDDAEDEDWPTLGDACAVGVGACRAEGVEICGADAVSTVCDAVPGQPSGEICNGLDDDCSGAADDFAPQLPDHCGACGRACEVPHAVPACADSACVIGRCVAGFVDLDGDLDNGCEAACRPTEPPDELCDGLDNDCDGTVDGPAVCLGDAFAFCTLRRRAGYADALCEDFALGALERRYIEASPALPGDAPPSIVQRAYHPAAGDPATGGGHSTRLPIFGPGARLSFGLRWAGGRVGAGVFVNGARLDGDPANPGFGYGLEVSGPGDAPVLRVLHFPDGAVVAEASADALADGAAHRVEGQRSVEGAWTLRLDGRVLPLTVDAPDAQHADFDRVSLYAAATDGEASTLDDLLLELDPDGDDHYAPYDNCPDLANADQADANGDGVGSACDDLDGDGLDAPDDGCPMAFDPDQPDADGDGVTDACDADGAMLLIDSSAVWHRSPWLVDPISGVRHQLFPGDEGYQGFAGDPVEGRLAIIHDDLLEVRPVDGGEATPLALSASRPAWLDDGTVLYQDGQGAIWTIGADGAGAFPFAAPADGERIAAYTDRAGGRIVLVRAADGVATAEVLDPLGRPLLEPVLVPAAGGGAPPIVRLNPHDDRLLVAAPDGDAAGVGVLDPRRFVFQPVSAQPTTAALWGPDGEGFYAVEPAGAGHRLVHVALAGPDAPTVLVHPTANLAPTTLDWLVPASAPAPADGDHDGVHDRDDLCPAQRARGWVRAPVQISHVGSLATTLSFQWHGHEWSVGYTNRPNVHHSTYFRALDARGRARSVVTLTTGGAGYLAPVLAWSGRTSLAVSVSNATITAVRVEDGDRLTDRRAGPVILASPNSALWIRWSGSAFDVLTGTDRVEHLRLDEHANTLSSRMDILAGASAIERLAVAETPTGAFALTVPSKIVARLDPDLILEQSAPAPAGTWRDGDIAATADGAIAAVLADAGGTQQIWTQQVNANGIPFGGLTWFGTGGSVRLLRTDAGLLLAYRNLVVGGEANFVVHLDEQGHPRSRPIQLTPAQPIAPTPSTLRNYARFATDGAHVGAAWFVTFTAWAAVGDGHCLD